jgi:hypothetical protein
VDVYDTVNDLLFADAFDLVSVAEVHGNWVSGGGNIEGQELNFREGGLEAVPLSLALFAALGFGKWIGEDSVILAV